MLLCQSRHIQTETTHADSHRGKALCLWHLQCQVCPSLSELLLDWGWLCFFPSRFAVMGTVQVQCGRDLGLHQSVSQSVLSLYGALSLWRLILAHGVCGREVLFKVLGIESYTCTVIGLFQCIVSALLLLCVWTAPVSVGSSPCMLSIKTAPLLWLKNSVYATWEDQSIWTSFFVPVLPLLSGIFCFLKVDTFSQPLHLNCSEDSSV